MAFTTHSKRVFGLDLMRATAIILVVLGHGAFILEDTVLSGFPYLRTIDGVDIFFVLSGFLIGRILLKTLQEEPNFTLKHLLYFWKRRWFRTLPNYYLILAANYLVVRYGIIEEHIDQFSFHFITFTQNFSTPFGGFFWESWSLSVEEWFYLITPVLIFILLKILPAKSSYLAATTLVIIFPLVYRFSQHNPNIDYYWWDVSFRKLVLCRLDSIGYGLLFAWVYFYYRSFWRQIKYPALLLGLVLMGFIVNYEAGPGSLYKQTVYFSLIPLAVMLLLPAAEAYKKASGPVAAAVQHISIISYSMYLINLALVAEVIRDNFTPVGGWDGLIKYLIYWTVVIVVSTLLYRYFEKPIMDLRGKPIRWPFQTRKASESN
jgi:peptidoglycan/LPS O-acetylase OafA/YrhL